MGLLKIFLVPSLNRILAGKNTKQAGSLPAFVQGDQLTIELMLLTPATSGIPTAPYEQVSVASYSPKVGLFTSAGTQLAYQNTFTADVGTNIYTGTLNLSTAAVDSALAAVAYGQALTTYFEIKTTDGLGNALTGLQATSVKLYKTLITAGSLVVPPAEVAATQSWVLNTFVRNDEPAGAVRIRRSPSGKQFLEWIDDDGQPHYDPIT